MLLILPQPDILSISFCKLLLDFGWHHFEVFTSTPKPITDKGIWKRAGSCKRGSSKNFGKKRKCKPSKFNAGEMKATLYVLSANIFNEEKIKISIQIERNYLYLPIQTKCNCTNMLKCLIFFSQIFGLYEFWLYM